MSLGSFFFTQTRKKKKTQACNHVFVTHTNVGSASASCRSSALFICANTEKSNKQIGDMSNWGLTVDHFKKNFRWLLILQDAFLLTSVPLWCVMDSYLSKFVYLLNHSSKQRTHALIDQTLHVVNGLLIRQVQSELVLHLMAHKWLVTIMQSKPD